MQNIINRLMMIMGRDNRNHGRSLPWRQVVLSSNFAITTLVTASRILLNSGKMIIKLAIHAPRETVKPKTSVRYWLK